MRPGLQGDYTGTCVACLTPTDTALGANGDAEWIIGFLVSLGIEFEEALKTLEWSEDSVPSGVIKKTFRVCKSCADRNGFPVALWIAGAEIPYITHP